MTQKTAWVCVIEGSVEGELGDLSDVMEDSPRNKEVLIDPLVSRPYKQEQLDDGEGMLQQPPKVDMMDSLGGWRQLEFFYEIFIGKKDLQKLPQKWMLDLGSYFTQISHHLFRIPRRLREKVVQLDLCLLALSQFHDPQLERSLKFINFGPHFDKIVLCEKGGKVHGAIPNPSIYLSRAVSETEGEIRVTALRLCEHLFSDEEGTFYALALLEFADENFDHIYLLS